MYKWVYDKMVKEYSRETKEELILKIVALNDIECSDRSFANECEAGTSIYNINELFNALDELQSGFTYEKAAKVYKLTQIAKENWDYIKNELNKINDTFRFSDTLEDFKRRVSNAKCEMDII